MPKKLPIPSTHSNRILDYRESCEFGTRVIRVNLTLPTPRISSWVEQGFEQFPYSVFLDELIAHINDAKVRLGIGVTS